MFKLFAFKQVLLGDSREKEGIKWHMMLHMPTYTKCLGPASVLDMIRTESSNSTVKSTFNATSKRLGTTHEEILSRVCNEKALKEAIAERDKHPDLVRSPLPKKVENLDYITETNIVYTTTTGPQHREEVSFDSVSGLFIPHEKRSFTSPSLSNEEFHNLLADIINDSSERVDGNYV